LNDEKYIGMDAHQATILVAVTDRSGKLGIQDVIIEPGPSLEYGGMKVDFFGAKKK